MGGSSIPSFAGEQYLEYHLPNYDHERTIITIQIVLTAVAFFLVIPYALSRTVYAAKDANGGTPENKGKRNMESATVGAKKKQNKRRKTGGEKKTAKIAAESSTGIVEAQPAIPIFVMNMLNVCGILLMALLVMHSTNNRILARSIFQAPIFTPEECQRVINMSLEAAAKNVEEAEKIIADYKANIVLSKGQSVPDEEDDEAREEAEKIAKQEPLGWRKDRHKSYPTTDLNVVTDPFSKEDREFLREKFDARLAPLIERIFGIARGAVRANDMFVVRYDASKGQPNLRKHTDSGHVSFNILLNDEFEGGGTRFHNRRLHAALDVHPAKGQVLINPSSISHEGLAVTSGTRYILVGFTSVDEKDPLTAQPTGLSAFASWLSLQWLQVRFNEGYVASHTRLEDNEVGVGSSSMGGASQKWTDNKYVRSLFRDIHNYLAKLSDSWAHHLQISLVSEENASAYLAVLDEAERERSKKLPLPSKSGRPQGRSWWFGGQQLDVDVDGTLANVWKTREDAGEESFEHENL